LESLDPEIYDHYKGQGGEYIYIYLSILLVSTVCFRIIEQPRLEGTSKDHMAQTLLGKGA